MANPVSNHGEGIMSKQLTVLDNVELIPVSADELTIGHAYYITTEREEETPLSSLTFYRPEPNLKTGDHERVDQELRNEGYLPGYLTVVAKDDEKQTVTVRNAQTTQEQTFLYGEDGYQYEDINNPGEPVEHQEFGDDHEQQPAVALNPGHSQLDHADGLTAEESARQQSHSDTTPRDFSRVDGDTTRDDRRGTGNEVRTDDAGPSGSTVASTDAEHTNHGDNSDGESDTTLPGVGEEPTEENTNPDNDGAHSDEPKSDDDENKIDVQPIIGGGDKTTK